MPRFLALALAASLALVSAALAVALTATARYSEMVRSSLDHIAPGADGVAPPK